MAIGDRVTLSGTVRVEGRAAAVARGVLVVAGKKIERRAGGRFALELDGGARVEVDATGAVDFGTDERSEAPWGQLAKTPVARLFRDDAPGDHVEVTLTGYALVDGDAIALEADVVEERAGKAGGGYRDSARPEPARVKALRVVVGSDVAAAAAALAALHQEASAEDQRKAESWRAEGDRKQAEAARAAEKRREEQRRQAERASRPPYAAWPKVTALLAAAAAGGGAIALAHGDDNIAGAAFAVTIALLSSAVAVAIALHPMPDFREGNAKRKHRTGTPWTDAAVLTSFASGATAIALLLAVAVRERGTGRVALVIAIISPVVALLAFRGRRRPMARLALIARSAETRVLEDEAWGVVRGRAAGGDPGTPLALAEIVYETKSETRQVVVKIAGSERYRDRKHTWVEPIELIQVPPSLTVKSGDTDIEVAVIGGLWTSLPAGIVAGKREPVVSQSIRPGDLVWVLGRIRTDKGAPRMRATGPESLIVVAASGDVGRAIARARNDHFARQLALVMLAAGGVALIGLLGG